MAIPGVPVFWPLLQAAGDPPVSDPDAPEAIVVGVSGAQRGFQLPILGDIIPNPAHVNGGRVYTVKTFISGGEFWLEVDIETGLHSPGWFNTVTVGGLSGATASADEVVGSSGHTVWRWIVPSEFPSSGTLGIVFT